MAEVPAALRQRFLQGLPQRWAAVEQAASADACAQALHRLAGAAGSYGFDALGAAARRAEQSCAAAGGGWPEPAALADLRRTLDGVLAPDDTTR